ncbi:hypothetical protein [Bacillus pumilus]|uniref:hypothetical protein n=1 Tax=Bacillus pumilus TaxID=1408 RepID=UPI002ABE8E23|nr:hypothetical protein [Bacillus pumilus]
MSEEQQVQGDRWTTQTLNILKRFGWEQKGDANFDIPCSGANKSKHGTNEKGRKNPHGIDLLLSYFDPYKSGTSHVIVESKERKWNGITSSSLQDFVTQLSNTLECARTNPTINNDLGCTNLNEGLLMVWCNEPEKYDEDKFQEYLSELKISRRKRPLTLYIASNKEILRWCSIVQKIKELQAEGERLEFFFPGDYFSKGLTTVKRQQQLNITHMFSDYIFAKGEKSLEVLNITVPENIHHVFFFAEPTIEELRFMNKCIASYQMEDAHKLIIHIHGEQRNYRTHIHQFLNEKQAILDKDNSKLKIQIDYMNELKRPPENLIYKE